MVGLMMQACCIGFASVITFKTNMEALHWSDRQSITNPVQVLIACLTEDVL